MTVIDGCEETCAIIAAVAFMVFVTRSLCVMADRLITEIVSAPLFVVS